MNLLKKRINHLNIERESTLFCHVHVNFIMKTAPWTCLKKGLIILTLKERALYFVLEEYVMKDYNSIIMNKTHS